VYYKEISTVAMLPPQILLQLFFLLLAIDFCFSYRLPSSLRAAVGLPRAGLITTLPLASSDLEASAQRLSLLYVLSAVTAGLVATVVYNSIAIATLKENIVLLNAEVGSNREDLAAYKERTRAVSNTVNSETAYAQAGATILATTGTALSIKSYFDQQRSVLHQLLHSNHLSTLC